MEEATGFEPATVFYAVHVFKTSVISHSTTPPRNFLAETVGFEPTMGFKPCLFSKQVQSATLPRFHEIIIPLFLAEATGFEPVLPNIIEQNCFPDSCHQPLDHASATKSKFGGDDRIRTYDARFLSIIP